VINPPMRGPGEKVGGLYHFGRMLDKIRLHLRGKLPEEYRPNYGWGLGLDGFSCGFLGVAFEDVEAQVVAGGSDEEILEWCFATGMRPNKVQTRVLERIRPQAGVGRRRGPRDAQSKGRGRHDGTRRLVDDFQTDRFPRGQSRGRRNR